MVTGRDWAQAESWKRLLERWSCWSVQKTKDITSMGGPRQGPVTRLLPVIAWLVGTVAFCAFPSRARAPSLPLKLPSQPLNAISSSLTVCRCPSPQLPPSCSKQGSQCTCGRHGRGWKGSSVGGTRRARYPFIRGMDVQVTKFKTLRKAMIPEHGSLTPGLQFL